MFTKRKPNTENLDELINELQLRVYRNEDLDAKESAKLVDQLIQLYKLRENENSRFSVNPDVLATIAANLAGILLILSFEHAGVVTSKALSFVLKLR